MSYKKRRLLVISKGIMSLSLVFFSFFLFKVFFFALKVNIYLQSMRIKHRLARFDQKTCIFVMFLCAVCLPSSLIMHVPISELHAQWHWCLHFRMSLNSQRFLQFHPTVMLMAYDNSCFIIIRQNSLPVSFSSRIS